MLEPLVEIGRWRWDVLNLAMQREKGGVPVIGIAGKADGGGI
jgi:hypothetical protein